MALTPDRWQEVLRLHEAASALPAAEREAFLTRECQDPEVLSEVRRMLAAPSSDDFLEPPPLDEPSAGRDLGDFTLLEEIGRGGMGVVYRALQRPLQRIVAVKVLPASFALTQRQIDRFVREARSMARLAHPNVVAVLTVGEEEGVRYFAMEYVDGKNLDQELRRLRADLGAEEDQRAHLPSSHAAEYLRSIAECIRQAADGLQHAHEHRLIHRDVKPSNLLLDPTGRIKLVDFGLARDEELGSLSASGDVVGTPYYMSPEQARAKRNRIDHRTDIYSLGVVLYELLTLRRPFEGKTSQEVIDNLQKKEPPRIRRLNPRVPRDLATICAKAMAREPRDRYVDAGALRDDLQRFLSHQAIVARPPGLAYQAICAIRRHAVPIGLAAVLAVGAGGGVTWNSRTVASRTRAELRQAVLELDPELDLSLVDDERLRAARTACTRLEHEGDAADRTLAARLRQRFDELRRSWRDEALRRIEAGKRSRPPESIGGVDDSEVLAGFLLLTRALKLFPQDEELFGLVSLEVFHPRVSIQAQDGDGRPVQGVASYRELDQVTGLPGDRVPLGSLPLVAVPLRPGFYRFVVEGVDGRFREFTRVLRRAEDQEPILCVFQEGGDSFPGMQRIAGGILRLRPTPVQGELCPFNDGQVPVASFWLDETEVTNAQYRRFLAATGSEAPFEWRWLPADPRHDDQPVVAVSWREAIRYAEWAGKRLPSHAEWELAARGPDGSGVPTAPDEYRGTVDGPDPAGGVEERFRSYLEHTTPVRLPPEARALNGLYHMFGNVAEWTESLGFDLEGGTHRPQPQYRVVLGCAWNARTSGYSLASHRLWEPERSYVSVEHGFRCARSERP